MLMESDALKIDHLKSTIVGVGQMHLVVMSHCATLCETSVDGEPMAGNS